MINDVLTENLRIIFCGTAVGNQSFSQQAYYANSSNKFWTILHRTGLTSHLIEPNSYEEILKYKLGLTDLAKNKSGMDKTLCSTDFNRDGLKNKILKYQPRILCFNGKEAAKQYFKHKEINYGLQSETINKTQIFVAPSTSDANAYWEEKYWFQLADLVDPRFKYVTHDNFFQPDEIFQLFGKRDMITGTTIKYSEKDFVDEVKGLELHYSIPRDIRNMFEIAKALYCYGYLYYQFFTLAFEQSLKCLEAILTLKYENLGGDKVMANGNEPNFNSKIKYLYKNGKISADFKDRLHAYRQLRNYSFHPSYQHVNGHSSQHLCGITEVINKVWTL